MDIESRLQAAGIAYTVEYDWTDGDGNPAVLVFRDLPADQAPEGAGGKTRDEALANFAAYCTTKGLLP